MFTSDVEKRKQRSQNNMENEHNSDKTKKNFTGSYTKVNPDFCCFILKYWQEFNSPTVPNENTLRRGDNLE